MMRKPKLRLWFPPWIDVNLHLAWALTSALTVMLALMVHASISTTSVTKQLLINHSMILMEAGRLENLKIGALVHLATLQLSVHSTIKESLAVTMPHAPARIAIHLTSICLTVIQARLSHWRNSRLIFVSKNSLKSSRIILGQVCHRL